MHGAIFSRPTWQGLHFRHPWRSDVESKKNAYVYGWTVVVGQCRSNCRGAVFCHSIHRDKKLIINIKKTICHLDQRDRYMDVVIPLVEMTVKSE